MVKGVGLVLYGFFVFNGIINVCIVYVKLVLEIEVVVFYIYNFSFEDECLKWWDIVLCIIGVSVAYCCKMGKLDLVMGGYYLNEESYNEGVFCCIGCFNVGICYCVIDCLIIGLNVNINVGEIVFFFYWASDIVVY